MIRKYKLINLQMHWQILLPNFPLDVDLPVAVINMIQNSGSND